MDIADLAKTAVSRIWPDKTAEEQAQLVAALLAVQRQLDAATSNGFTSGWRPGIGWVCAGALAMQYLARPMIAWIGIVTGHPYPQLPSIDDGLWQLMLGMLGLGGLRTYEKTKGVA